MARQVRFDGRTISVPDDATDEEVAAIIDQSAPASAPAAEPDDYASRMRAESAARIRARPFDAGNTSALNTYGVQPGAAPQATLTDRISASAPMRVLRGVADPVFGAAQLVTGGAEPVQRLANAREEAARGAAERVAKDRIAQLIATPEWQDLARKDPGLAQYQVDKLAPGIDVSRLVGGMVLPGAVGVRAAGLVNPLIRAAPGAVTRTVARGATGGAGGALTGAVQPVETTEERPSYPEQVKRNMAAGGIGGAVASVLGSAAGRALNPQTREPVRQLMERGVTPTPGQIVGGPVQAAEEAVARLPVLGAPVRMAQERGATQARRAVFNEALRPIGAELPAGLDGREAVAATRRAVSRAYDNAIDPIGPQRLDTVLQNDMLNIAGSLNGLPPRVREDFIRYIDDQVAQRARQSNGTLDGRAFKIIESNLGKRGTALARGNADEQELGRALGQARDAMRAWLVRRNPDSAEQIRNANEAYRRYQVVKEAAARTGDRSGGEFTPDELMAAIRSKGRDQYAAGAGALQREIAGPASEVLQQTGTNRFLGPLGDLAAAGAALTNPLPAIAGLGAGALAYSPLAQRLTAGLLARRTPGMRRLGDLIGSQSATALPAMAGSAADERER